MMGNTSLIGLSNEALRSVLEQADVPSRQVSMRAQQLFHWIYHRGARQIDQMTTLPEGLRQTLGESWSIDRPDIGLEQVSSDGTTKWLLSYHDGQEVEAVHIPDVERGALCLSSQVGCSLACTFCHTGTMPLVRNLSAGDMLGQILLARDQLGEWPTPMGQRRISHLVMMGMGEPLLNYDHVATALKIAMNPKGLGFSKRKITLSTSGIVPKIERCGEELGVNLAISLHAVRDELRDELVPINRKWNIKALMEACRAYPSGDRWVTFEYVMLDGINDSDADARELVRLIKGLPAKVNLIPFNPWPGSAYHCSSPQRIDAFARIVMRAGYPSPVRTPRGQDILAACGQLKTASERQRMPRGTDPVAA